MIPKLDMQCDEAFKWWSTTLLSDIYEIVAKTFSLRLRPLMTLVIYYSQSGFLQDKSFFYNILSMLGNDSYYIANKTKLAVLLLDLENGYNKVDWDFLEAVPIRLGFPKAWIKATSTLYRNAPT